MGIGCGNHISRLNDGDILVYADSGCVVGSVLAFEEIFRTLESEEFISAFASHINRPFCSKILRATLSNEDIDNRLQIAGTILFFRVTENTRALISEWYSLCCDRDLLVDPNRSDEDSTFIDHRHDQAILSCLVYSKYSQIIPTLRNEIVWGAIFPQRMRHGKTFLPFEKNSLNSYLIPLDQFEKVEFSSHTPWSKNELQDIVKPDFSGSHFAFHTDAELSPWARIYFKKKTRLAMIVLENRSGVEGRIKKLVIKSSSDGITFQHICTSELEFGGYYDNSPFILSFPYFFEAVAIEILSCNSFPDYFHLKNISFYGILPNQ